MGEYRNLPEIMKQFEFALQYLRHRETATGLHHAVSSIVDTPVTYRLEDPSGVGLQVSIGDFRFLGVEREAITRFIKTGKSGYHLSATGIIYLDQPLWDTYVAHFARTGRLETEMADTIARVIGEVLFNLHNVRTEFVIMLGQENWSISENTKGTALSFFIHIPVEKDHYMDVMNTIKLNLQAASLVPIAVETEQAMVKAIYTPGNSTLN